jgi:hypothetical protein
MLRLAADENLNMVPFGMAIADLALFVECSREDGWEGQVLYLPL